jgi:hypothetical protein
MARRFFFFPHRVDAPPLRARLKEGSTPWRVPYRVAGSLVSSSGVEVGEGLVMGDGFQVRDAPVIVGGNQDPCLFCAPLSGLHAFCRIASTQGADNDVVGLARREGLLPSVVSPGDVIIYGKPNVPRDQIAVDTVLVVEEAKPFKEVVAAVGVGTDAYAFNLSDAQPSGSHEGEDSQLVIVGRASATVAAVESLATSFVPLAERDADGRWQVVRVTRQVIGAAYDDLRAIFVESMFSGSGAIANKGRICELPAVSGEALARAVIARSRKGTASGVVFIPPLRPTGRTSPRRLGGDGVVRDGDAHMARLAPNSLRSR